jgi:hypothetical protein
MTAVAPAPACVMLQVGPIILGVVMVALFRAGQAARGDGVSSS